MTLFVEEIGTTPHSTASQLFLDNRPFAFVVEDGYREQKVMGETRIPAGRYQVVQCQQGRFFAAYKNRFGHDFVPYLKNVPGFEGVLLHIGNTVNDTQGCLLICSGIKMDTDGSYLGVESTAAYRRLYSMLNLAYQRGEEVWLEISRREIITEDTPKG